MKIYIAGPYTKGDVAQNVRDAIYTGNILALRGHIVFIPHLTHFWHMLTPNTYEFWMKQDEAWLRECDALFRIEGESVGADKEVAIAQELGLPIYTNVFMIPDADDDDCICGYDELTRLRTDIFCPIHDKFPAYNRNSRSIGDA